MKSDKKSQELIKRGPVPETLKIEGDWKKAVKGALKKKRPDTGWPKPEKPSSS